MTFNMNGGQFNLAKDNATINATQNNCVKVDELESIIKGILQNIIYTNPQVITNGRSRLVI